MKSLIICLIAVCVSSAAGAEPVDPDPDGIGIYFTEEAGNDSWCATAASGTQLTAYVCLTRAADTSGFTAWEGRVECSVPEAVVGYTIRGGGTNASVEPDFLVSFPTPLPYQISTVILEVSLDVVWEWSIALRLWPAEVPSGAEALPAYTTTALAGAYRTLGYSFGWNPATKVPNWCASINDDSCLAGPSVPAEDQSWGSVKALYR